MTSCRRGKNKNHNDTTNTTFGNCRFAQLVYQLYNLTDDEIRLVEEAK